MHKTYKHSCSCCSWNKLLFHCLSHDMVELVLVLSNSTACIYGISSGLCGGNHKIGKDWRRTSWQNSYLNEYLTAFNVNLKKRKFSNDHIPSVWEWGPKNSHSCPLLPALPFQLPLLFPEILNLFIFSPLLIYLNWHQYMATASHKQHKHTQELWKHWKVNWCQKKLNMEKSLSHT